MYLFGVPLILDAAAGPVVMHPTGCHLMWSTLLRTLQLRMCMGCILEGGAGSPWVQSVF